MHMPKMVMNATNILEKKGIFGRDTLHRFLGPFCLLRVMMKFLKWKNVFKNAPPHPHSVILLHLITMTVDNFLSPQQGSSTRLKFNFSFIHMKYVVFLCRKIKILISNWPRTQKFSQLLQAGKTVKVTQPSFFGGRTILLWSSLVSSPLHLS